jgi:hypothetical protein
MILAPETLGAQAVPVTRSRELEIFDLLEGSDKKLYKGIRK